jgi:formylglycine-generating enzyme required for sulfatase activity
MRAGLSIIIWLTLILGSWLGTPKCLSLNQSKSHGINSGRSDIRSQRSALPRTRTNPTGIEFVLIPPGSFMMGSTNGDDDQKPVHQVTINYSFYMGKYEITQAQWQQVMGNNPSNFKGGNLPVERVSWNDAIAFIARLNGQNDGFRYKLPTEAEWEYACRAGTTGDYAGDLDAMAWYFANSGNTRLSGKGFYDKLKPNNNRTHPVGTKLPNAFGLFDMHGNVWEWCQDWYHDSYNAAPSDGSAWLSGGEQMFRVLRGGSWDYSADSARSACRFANTPIDRNEGYGFRVVAVPKNEKF